jgi:NAD(P)-dependent dehydrogenase (short-subunit alcohol dehydrogenase family)
VSPERSHSVEGRVAIVTGGAGGLGSATARLLRERGAEVVIADLAESSGASLAEEIGGAFIATDVTDPEANRAMFEFASERFGGVDLVHLNAGVASGIGLGEEFDLERYRQIMGVNLDGVVFGAVEALRALRSRGGGAIVATASLAGLTAVAYDPLYAANKHAVVGLTRSIGPALAAEGIRFNCVCPGFAESAIIGPIRDSLIESGLPIIPAERVAETVVQLFEGEMSGECWFVQAGRPAAAFEFRGIPGPRAG